MFLLANTGHVVDAIASDWPEMSENLRRTLKIAINNFKRLVIANQKKTLRVKVRPHYNFRKKNKRQNIPKV